MADDELAEIVAELEHVSERLADLALNALREAVEAGEQSRPDLERRSTRARNAVERAISLLSRHDRDDPEDLDP
jgi:hypothetical protein